MLLELGLEALEQGERVGRAAGEPGDHAVAVEAPHLAGVALHDGLAQRDLAVAAEGDRLAAAYTDDGGGVHGGRVRMRSGSAVYTNRAGPRQGAARSRLGSA